MGCKVLKNLYSNLEYYFKNISVHGLCSIFRFKLWYQKIFWLIIFLLAVHQFFVLLSEQMRQYYNQPVKIDLDTTSYPTALVPFPAVTICNFNIVHRDNTKKIEQILIKNGVKEEVVESFFKNLALLHSPLPIDTAPYRKVYKVLTENGYPAYRVVMDDIAQSCENMITKCTWAGTNVDCSSLFTRSKGDLGICCSFNSNLYPKYPGIYRDYYAFAGPLVGLHLKLNVATDQYVSPAYNLTGILVVVHDKNSYGDDSAFYSTVEPGKEALMKILPEVFEAEDRLSHIQSASRKCLLDGEGRRFLNMNYSFVNCMHMCKTNIVGKLCNCVPYNYANYGKLRTCTLLHMPCLVKNLRKYTALHMLLNTNENNKDEFTCDCLPACGRITYSGKVQPLFYFTLVGGLFSLCLGGSVVSGIELVYYFLKSILVNPQERNETFPELYWSEFDIYKRNLTAKNNRKQIVIFDKDLHHE